MLSKDVLILLVSSSELELETEVCSSASLAAVLADLIEKEKTPPFLISTIGTPITNAMFTKFRKANWRERLLWIIIHRPVTIIASLLVTLLFLDVVLNDTFSLSVSLSLSQHQRKDAIFSSKHASAVANLESQRYVTIDGIIHCKVDPQDGSFVQC